MKSEFVIILFCNLFLSAPNLTKPAMDDFLPMNPFQMPLWTDEKPNETEEEANARAQATQRAIETSTKIEAWLLDEKKALERRKRGIKILLLGRSSLVVNFRKSLNHS